MTVPNAPLVLFHADCMDGLVAAWVARRALGPDATLTPVEYGSSPPLDEAEGRDVLVVDFSYARADILALKARARSLRVLDHHKTAAARLAGLDACTFDVERSGARLAWDHLFPGAAAPWIVDYAEDRDLWRWRLPHSREVSAWLHARCRTVDDVEVVFGEGAGAAAKAGGHCRLVEHRTVASIASEARLGAFAGYVVPVVNAPRAYVSEVLERLAPGHAFAAAWQVRADGSVRYSLRSDPEGIDVSAVAACFEGGGGQEHAAGFTVPSLAELAHADVAR